MGLTVRSTSHVCISTPHVFCDDILMQETFRFIRDFEGEVPGTEPRDCGNCLLHNLPMAKYEAEKYLREVLDVATEENLNYPD